MNSSTAEIERLASDPKNREIVKRIASKSRNQDDCEQEIWLRLITSKSKNEIRDEQAFVARVALRARSSFHRNVLRNRPQTVDPGILQAHDDLTSNPVENQFLQEERLSFARQAVSALEPHDQDLILVFTGELTRKSYRDRYEVSERTVRRRLAALLEKFNEERNGFYDRN